MNQAANEIIKEFGLEELPEEEKMALITQLSDTVMQGVIVKSVALLTENQKNQLDALVEKDPENPDVIMDFLETATPNFGEIFEEELKLVKERAAKIARG